MHSEAAERNKEPILAVLRELLAQRPAAVLEIGSGTGQHAEHFARELPHLRWATSDVLANHPALEERVRAARLPNLAMPFELDVRRFPLVRSYDVVYTANTAHIMSFDEVRCMFAGVAQVLEPGGLFVLYGPVNRDGQFTSESNRAFDAHLRSRAAHMGLRDDRDLDGLAAAGGLQRIGDYDLPANNRVLVWQQVTGGGSGTGRGPR